MTSYIETGFVRVEVDLSILGALSEERATKIRENLIHFFKEEGLAVRGKIKHIAISTIELDTSTGKLDTSSK